MNDERAPASSPEPDSFLRRWVLASVGTLVAAAVVFVLGVCTRWGQQFGDAAYAGRMLSSPELRRGALDVLDTVRAASLVVIGGGVVVVALIGRRPRLAMIVAAIIGVSILGAEVLKRGLVRPDFGVDPPGMTANWAPSGHTTVAVTLVLCVLLVVPVRLRTVVALVGALYAAAIASATLAAGWHRPTDAVMAALWSFGVAAAGVSALVWWRGIGDDVADRPAHPRAHLASVVAVVIVPIAVLVAGFAVGHDPVVLTGLSGRFVVASIVIDLVAVAVVIGFARLLRGASLDPIHRPIGNPSAADSGGGDPEPVR